MSDTRDALDRYLDDFATGLVRSVPELDSTLVETIQRVHRIGAYPSADPAFTDRLEVRLMSAFTPSPGIPGLVRQIQLPPTRAPHRRVRIEQSRWLSVLVAAAVLVFAVGVVIRPFQTWRDRDRLVIPVVTVHSSPDDPRGAAGTTFRGDAARTGTMPGPGITEVPAIIWRSFVYGQSTGATPTVGGGLVVSVTDFFMSAMNLETGEEVWRSAILGSYSSPVIFGGRFYVGTQGNGVQAFELATGTELWTFRTGAVATHPDYPADAVQSSPVVVDGTLFVGGGFYGGLFALDPETGSERWRFDTHGEVWSSPAVAEGIVYITTQGLRDAYPEDSAPSALYAIDALTGELIWTFALGPSDTSFSTPMVSSGVVVFGATHEDTETGTYFAVDATTGSERWRVETEHPIWGRSPGSNGALVFLTEETDTVGNVIRAVDPADGTTVWTFEVQEERINGVVNTGEILYFKDNANDLIALDAATGAELWRITLGSGGSPVVVGGRIYVTGGINAYAIGTASDLPATPLPATGAQDAPGMIAIGQSPAGDNQLPGPSPSRDRYEQLRTTRSFFGVPVIYGDTVYGTHVIEGAEHDLMLTAYDLVSGDVAWETAIPAALGFVLTTHGILAAATDPMSAPGAGFKLTLIDLKRGERLWTSPRMYFAQQGSLQVDSSAIFLVTDTGEIVALEHDGGAEQWSYVFPRTLPAGVSPQICGGTSSCYDRALTAPRIISRRDTLYFSDVLSLRVGAVNAATGSLRWSVDLSERAQSRTIEAIGVVAVEGGVIVSTIDPELFRRDDRPQFYALLADEGGDNVWVGSLLRDTLISVAGPTSLYLDYRDHETKCCRIGEVSLATGDLLWSSGLVEGGVYLQGYLVESDEVVARVGSQAGRVFGIDAHTHETLWEIPIHSWGCIVMHLPLAADGTLSCAGLKNETEFASPTRGDTEPAGSPTVLRSAPHTYFSSA